jgi:hypothetical protein
MFFEWIYSRNKSSVWMNASEKMMMVSHVSFACDACAMWYTCELYVSTCNSHVLIFFIIKSSTRPTSSTQPTCLYWHGRIVRGHSFSICFFIWQKKWRSIKCADMKRGREFWFYKGAIATCPRGMSLVEQPLRHFSGTPRHVALWTLETRAWQLNTLRWIFNTASVYNVL